MCDLDQDGYGEVISDTKVVARKQHRCSECSRRIEPGQEVRRYVGKWEGDFFATKFCRRCSLMIDWLYARGHGWTGGRIVEEVRECAEEEVWKKRNAKAVAS